MSTEELEALRTELEHARMDLELKDAYALEMRGLALDRESEAHEVRMLAQALQRSVDDLHAQLLEARALLAARTGELAVAQSEVQRVETELAEVTSRSGYLLLTALTQIFARFRPASALARRVKGRMAGVARRHPPAGA